jgi:hypothetical protein
MLFKAQRDREGNHLQDESLQSVSSVSGRACLCYSLMANAHKPGKFSRATSGSQFLSLSKRGDKAQYDVFCKEGDVVAELHKSARQMGGIVRQGSPNVQWEIKDTHALSSETFNAITLNAPKAPRSVADLNNTRGKNSKRGMTSRS